MRCRLLIEYDGSAYAGWQIQKNKRTIQGEIEGALLTILKEPIKIIGAGRTDSGVHARGQVAHMDIDKNLDYHRLQKSLNGILDTDIRIREISQKADTFHARYSAIWREYHYVIARIPSALNRNYCWYLSLNLNLHEMRDAIHQIIGKHDFRSFCRLNSEANNYICLVKDANWIERKEFYTFKIIANRFLHGMVRCLVGTLVDIGRGILEAEEIKTIMNSLDRSKASQSAPAKGLILEKVYY